MALRWQLATDSTASAKADAVEWDENWNCYDFRPPAGEPAWVGLLADRPAFRPGAAHPSVRGAVVDGFDPERIGTTNGWKCRVRYRVALTAEEEKNPLNRRPVITTRSETTDVPAITDADGKPILTTAGSLVTGLTRTVTLYVFPVEVNVPDVPRWLLDYNDDGGAVNSDAVKLRGLTIPPGRLLLRGLTIPGQETQQVSENETVRYYPLSFELVYHPLGWVRRHYNRDFYELVAPADDAAVAAKLAQAVTDAEEHLAEARLLKSNDPSDLNKAAYLDARKALADARAAEAAARRTERVRIKVENADGELVDAPEPQFLDRSGKRPRVTRIVPDPDAVTQDPDYPDDPTKTIPDPDATKPETVVKATLDPSDIVILETWMQKRLPFRKLPIA